MSAQSTYTPYANLTDREFSLHLANLANPTDLDIEAMLRIDRLVEEVESLTVATVDEVAAA